MVVMDVMTLTATEDMSVAMKIEAMTAAMKTAATVVIMSAVMKIVMTEGIVDMTVVAIVMRVTTAVAVATAKIVSEAMGLPARHLMSAAVLGMNVIAVMTVLIMTVVLDLAMPLPVVLGIAIRDLKAVTTTVVRRPSPFRENNPSCKPV